MTRIVATTRLAVVSLAALAGAIASAPAAAQTIDITGTRANVNPLNPPGTGRCSPPYFNTVDIAPDKLSSTGTSNLGTFTSTQSHCIVAAPPTDIVDGIVTYTFRAGDSISGTYTGRVDATATPGSFAASENLVITGGTGRFVGATGTIAELGSLSFASGLATFSGTINGQLTALATTTSGDFATAFGAPSAALGDYASAYGAFAIANGARTTALGSFAEATAAGATAVGDQTVASGLSATALGQLAAATAPAASALGHNSVASAIGSTAVGVRANATALGATSVGRLSAASGANATALGASASATFAGSTAIGTGAATTAANQVALGGSGSSVRIGDISASSAAQTGALGVATVDAAGTLGRNTTLLSDVAALQSASGNQLARIDALFELRDRDRRDFKQGIAAATAMGQASFPSAPGRTSYVLNGATFRGETAVGGSIMHRFDGDTPFALGLGFSVAGHRNNAFRAGVAGEF
ncbi:hypothetical protein ACFO0A_01165 [Novosphingobium tardum]|uniref:Trimeric autotransporter adhesin YadA-like head domain-containing protein n=1 Tax=Novosphingobium tardum TaxID=1538021 RepID=A0ABV8RL79_9SPHN